MNDSTIVPFCCKSMVPLPCVRSSQDASPNISDDSSLRKKRGLKELLHILADGSSVEAHIEAAGAAAQENQDLCGKIKSQTF